MTMSFARPHLETVALLVDEAAILRYAAVSGDFNPIHIDPEFASKTEMGGVIAHGTLSLNLIWQALEQTLGREGLDTVDLDVRFRRPVRVGDRIEAGGALDENGERYRVWARNQDGVNIIEGTATRRSE